jgi:threonine dehydrogenase-like Zn-dependent dehydrogenase
MKGWKIINPLKIEEQDVVETEATSSFSKVKITKVLLTLADVLRYKGDIDCENVVIGSSAIGIVSDTETNLFGLEKGKHVYIDPNKECMECLECKSGNYNKCSSLLLAGEDFDGFLSDFANVDSGKLFILPDSVKDLDALFIEQISLAIAVVDKLQIQAGDYVAIIGANNFGNILAQLLIYYQAVPIVMTNNDEDYKIAKDSGIYYVLGQDDNWNKEVSAITSGRMTNSVVYISDCNISATKAFGLAAHNAGVAFTGVSYKNSPIPFAGAVKKQLNIRCINNGFGNTAASINLIANKAINLSHLKLDNANYNQVPEVLHNMTETLEKEGKIYETVIDLV